MPNINGLETLLREIAQLRAEIEKLKKANPRSLSLGTSYRIEVQGTGAGATLHAIRTADGNDKLLAP